MWVFGDLQSWPAVWIRRHLNLILDIMYKLLGACSLRKVCIDVLFIFWYRRTIHLHLMGLLSHAEVKDHLSLWELLPSWASPWLMSLLILYIELSIRVVMHIVKPCYFSWFYNLRAFFKIESVEIQGLFQSFFTQVVLFDGLFDHLLHGHWFGGSHGPDRVIICKICLLFVQVVSLAVPLLLSRHF